MQCKSSNCKQELNPRLFILMFEINQLHLLYEASIKGRLKI